MRIVILLALVLLSTGCSYYSLRATQRDIDTQRVLHSGDKVAMDAMKMGIPPESAIKVVRIGDDGVGVGIDLLSAEVFTTNTWRHIGAVVLDAIAIYYGQQALQNAYSRDGANAVSKPTTITVNTKGNAETTVTVTY